MKAVLSILMLVVGLASFPTEAQAQDNTNGSNEQVAQSNENFLPRGGWDGNNLRISATQSKLIASQAKETSFRGGGWDANNLRISVTQSKLLAPQAKETSIRGGGWDLNNLRISVTQSKLLGAQK